MKRLPKKKVERLEVSKIDTQKTSELSKKNAVQEAEKEVKNTPVNSDKKTNIAGMKSNLMGLRNVAGYLDFIDWIALPTIYREPKTQKEFAKQIGVSEDTMTDWKKRLGFRDDVDTIRIAWARELSGDMLLALRKTILKYGRGADVKVWLQYTGEFTNKTEGEDIGVDPEIQAALDKFARLLP